MNRLLSCLLSGLLAVASSCGCIPHINPGDASTEAKYYQDKDKDKDQKPGTPPAPDPQPEPDPDPVRKELVVVTYNVAALGRSMDNVVQYIRDAGADLVGLNELDSMNNRHNVYQLEKIAQALGSQWRYKFGSAMHWEGGKYGNGAMANKALLDTATIHLVKGYGGHETRSVAVIETEDVVFGAVHLDFLDGLPDGVEPTREQAAQLTGWFEERYNGYSKPVILAGDFNTEPASNTQKDLAKNWERLSERVNSWPCPDPYICLDYVFYLKSAVPVEAVETARLTDTVDYGETSDHYPVRVKIRFTVPQAEAD